MDEREMQAFSANAELVKKAETIVNRWCADPLVWATHGMPGDAKLWILVTDIHKALCETALAFSRRPLPTPPSSPALPHPQPDA